MFRTTTVGTIVEEFGLVHPTFLTSNAQSVGGRAYSHSPSLQRTCTGQANQRENQTQTHNLRVDPTASILVTMAQCRTFVRHHPLVHTQVLPVKITSYKLPWLL